jgi:hypothetical protein
MSCYCSGVVGADLALFFLRPAITELEAKIYLFRKIDFDWKSTFSRAHGAKSNRLM